MKKHKIILMIIAIIALVSVFATACDALSSLGSSQSADGGIYPTDSTTIEATGGSQGSSDGGITVDITSESASDYLETELTATTEEQSTVQADEATSISIDLTTLTADNAPEGTTFKKDVLTINAAGTYVLSGTLNGAVSVAKNVEGTVQIILNGATIHTKDTQTVAAITFYKTDSQRILTVAAGTVNEVSDSVGDTEADGDGAAIQAKGCSLTINGQGTLKVLAMGEDANGIKVKNSLTVIGTTLEVTATKNGIKADNLVSIQDATVTVTAGNDGIKTDIEPETEEEALAYAADKTAGYIYIKNSTLTVTAGDDGIAANNCLYIDNDADDTITVTTNGGAPQSVTERSSDAADGKALKAAGIVLEDEEGNETEYPATFDENYAVVITGGTFVLNSNDDAIHSKGNLLITGGTFTIASGDDGIHAEYVTKITGGDITITKSYEGVEGALVEITGGKLDVTAVDDGVNAANSDLKNYSFNIYVTGGEVKINCSGDGMDSNGKLVISGGTVTVFGPTNGGNSALDSETGTTIQGGTVIATCAEAMDAVKSTQYMINANVRVSANTTVTLKDASGNTVLSFVQPKACNNIIISSADLTSGTYTLTCGTASVSVTAAIGSTGSMGGMGGNPSGQPGMGGRGGKGAPNGALSEDGSTNGMPPVPPTSGDEMPDSPTDGEMPTPPQGFVPFDGSEMTPPTDGEMPEPPTDGGQEPFGQSNENGAMPMPPQGGNGQMRQPPQGNGQTPPTWGEPPVAPSAE